MIELREIKAGFFDTQAVKNAVSAANRKALSKFGAFVRRRAQTSIRKSKKSAQPGEPPKSHEGSLRRLIFFSLDLNRLSVIIGPVKFRKGDAPRLLEKGGTTTRPTKTKGMRTLRYRGNPFMAPAAKAELPNFGELLRSMAR